jgi:membrane protein DedA with SNARE-associated domain
MLLSQHELIHFISIYGYAVVALIIGLESLGLPLPGETVLITAAIYAGRSHDLNIWLVVGAAALGAILGNTAGFWIGWEGGYRFLLRYGSRLHLTEGRIKLGQFLFRRHGGAIIFFSRFIPVLRAFGALLAGANRMSWRSFFLFNIAGATVWAMLFGGGAFYLGTKIHSFTRYGGIGTASAAVILLAIVAAYLGRHEARLQSEAERELPGPLATP